ncbi:DMT family protein [Pedobacter sp. BS3]|uniref:DMT family protein n=1 Tax=Pedobacter sp. BS3 TaxID=2567937 RepID=UPI0011EBF41A|nr:DMT family protein [Pedobacter sp. BS3]TZF83155.1 DMT family protein [Pedobacter sp. BS3]
MRALFTVALLLVSNTFMTLAWYGHLKFKDMDWSRSLGLVAIILISWAIAFFEYVFQVPANRFGFKENGGPFNLLQLKVLQEAISITVFLIFTVLVFKTEKIAWNHLVGFTLIILAVFFIFKKW